MEPNETSLKTGFRSVFFQYNHLVFVFRILMVQLWDFLENPKCLTIHLFAEIRIEDVSKLELAADSHKRKEVAQRTAIVLDSLLRVGEELFDLGVDLALTSGKSSMQRWKSRMKLTSRLSAKIEMCVNSLIRF